jgi:hypothetical protein
MANEFIPMKDFFSNEHHHHHRHHRHRTVYLDIHEKLCSSLCINYPMNKQSNSEQFIILIGLPGQ